MMRFVVDVDAHVMMFVRPGRRGGRVSD
jgi:hypothetical protein